MKKLQSYTTAEYRHLNGKRDYLFVTTKELTTDASLKYTVNNAVQVGTKLVTVGKYCPVVFLP